MQNRSITPSEKHLILASGSTCPSRKMIDNLAILINTFQNKFKRLITLFLKRTENKKMYINKK